MASFLSWKFIVVLVVVVLVNAAALWWYLAFSMPGAGVPTHPDRERIAFVGWVVFSPVAYGAVFPLSAMGVDWRIGAAFGTLMEAIVVHLGVGWLSCKWNRKPVELRNLVRFRMRELLVFVTLVCLGCAVYAAWRTSVTRGPAYRGRMQAMGIGVSYSSYDHNSVRSVLVYIKGYERWLTSQGALAAPSLPPELAKMKNLERLCFDGLTSLPLEIGALDSLRFLHLNDHNLTALPPEIGNLSNLRELHLQGNALTALPPEIGRLTALEKLNLAGNPITDSALEHLAPLENLQWVLLRDTKVTEAGSRRLGETLPKCKVFRVSSGEN